MAYFNIVAQTTENTVVTEYKPAARRSDFYQSEAALEDEFIRLLCEQGYIYLPIHSEKELILNLRNQLEELNRYQFSDTEWERFFSTVIANANDSIVEKTTKIQEDNIQVLKRDDGMTKNITLIDRENIHNNRLQVINQYEVSTAQGAKHDNRYDVTILVNGFPLVHVELKRRGVAIREAFNQINRYSRDSFWAGCGLFEYVQIFVISNGTHTKYYSNSTRYNAIKDINAGLARKGRTSNSFEFTSFWADANNKVISDLIDFAGTFFAKHTLLNILTKYCVFTSENILMVMRPYQITATERIINRIEVAYNYKKYGSVSAGGYIWHTTGSGKTLTSFKTARIASRLSFIDKVLFVVDRKDLDYQTMKEYDRFEKGAANSNTSTKILEKQLSDSESKIIITTIQKLATFIKKNKEHAIYRKQIVIIFDECHRSQFGDMHKAIVRYFKRYYMFGFTGTPIFALNAGIGTQNPNYFTTEQTFGDQLHAYTIVDAINDKNVLPFRVDYIKTMDFDADIDDEKVWDIDRKKAFEAPERIRLVANYILNHFDQKTYRGDKTYVFNALANISEVASADRGKVEEIKQKQRLSGFNSILAVSSIPMAKRYYDEFRKIIKDDPTKNLNIAVIYSYAPNEEEETGILDEENSEDTSSLDQTARDFLDSAIDDYNKMFHTSYDTSSEKFQNYYKDVSLRMKNKELDLLIVVNMFLTGFDATTLNTLWVDKNLKLHGLIQAFSRTNRILNSIKTFGNIVCFRNLKKRVDTAISLFGDRDARSVVLMHSFKDYYYGYEDIKGHHSGYEDMIEDLITKFPVSEPQIIGEQNQREFITLFGAILRMRNLLLSFDDFKGKEILSERDLQDYLGKYQDLRDEWIRRRENGEITDITDDIVFEIELIKQIEINIDYILILVKKYHDSHSEDREVLVTIKKAIDASPELRSKKKLIEAFIADVNTIEDVIIGWNKYVSEQREKELNQIIEEERLNPEETRKFLENTFRYGEVKTVGTDINKIMPPMSRFGGGNRTKKKQTIIEKIQKFFEKYFGIGAIPKFTDLKNK